MTLKGWSRRYLSRRRLGWVVAAWGSRVAPQDSPDPFRCSFEGTVLFDGFDHVLRAAGSEAAMAPEERADRSLVELDHGDKDPSERGFHP